jgi:hypothetical protein
MARAKVTTRLQREQSPVSELPALEQAATARQATAVAAPCYADGTRRCASASMETGAEIHEREEGNSSM